MEALQTINREERRKDTFLKIVKPSDYDTPADRPGWIPPDITHEWDTDPYAYQTEEELMPGGGLHGRILAYMMAILQDFIETRDMMLLMDTFMLYRDTHGVKQRIAPDLLLMPFRYEPPSAYDLEVETTPLLVGEITSPESHAKDLENNVSLYAGFGIPSYLVIDPITPQKRRRKQIRLYLWQNSKGHASRIEPDADGYLLLPQMHVKIKAQGHNMIFADMATGELLKDSTQFRQLAESEIKRRKHETVLLKQEVERERQRAEQEIQRAERLAAKLRELGVSQ